MAFALYLILFFELVSAVDFLPIFRGFDATWRRKVLGFETPHRISRLDNYISNNGSSLVANFGLSPGVDGDYAQPEIYWDLLTAKSPTVIKNLTFRWQDNATRSNGSSWLSAEADFSTRLDGSDPVVFLGFSMNTSCVNPDCGQHGIWLSFFRVGVNANRYAFLQMTRTESPDSAGKGKPFIMQMAFTASIYYTEAIGFEISNKPSIFYNDTIHSEGRTTNVEFGSPATTVGISALGFELFPTEATKDRPLGRYIESMHFESQLVNSGTSQANVSFNVRSPSTTHDSGVTYFVTPVSVYSKASTTSGTSKGSICVSGDVVGKFHLNRTFVCAKHGLNDQVVDHSLIV